MSLRFRHQSHHVTPARKPTRRTHRTDDRYDVDQVVIRFAVRCLTMMSSPIRAVSTLKLRDEIHGRLCRSICRLASPQTSLASSLCLFHQVSIVVSYVYVAVRLQAYSTASASSSDTESEGTVTSERQRTSLQGPLGPTSLERAPSSSRRSQPQELSKIPQNVPQRHRTPAPPEFGGRPPLEQRSSASDPTAVFPPGLPVAPIPTSRGKDPSPASSVGSLERRERRDSSALRPTFPEQNRPSPPPLPLEGLSRSNSQRREQRDLSALQSSQIRPNPPPPPPPVKRNSQASISPPLQLPLEAGERVNVMSASTFAPPPISKREPSMRGVRWDENLICPSPVPLHARRKGWYNRRGQVQSLYFPSVY
jgi:hypothetical protein